MGIGKAALQNTGHTFDLAVQLRTLEEAFPNLMVVGSRLWIELAVHLNGREKTKTPLYLFLLICLECEWYGQLYCSGDIIIDLYSWKFLKTCAGGKMVRFLIRLYIFLFGII